jgi:hypothetical protein
MKHTTVTAMILKTQPPCSTAPWFVIIDGFAMGGGNSPAEALLKLQQRKQELTKQL